jgi:hypothetical protein
MEKLICGMVRRIVRRVKNGSESVLGAMKKKVVSNIKEEKEEKKMLKFFEGKRTYLSDLH